MRIVVVQDYLRNGGTEKHSVFLANHFDHEGHESTLLSFRPGGVLKAQLQTPHRALQPFDSKLDTWAPLLQKRLGALAPDVVLLMGRAANTKLPHIRAAAPAAKIVATLRTGTDLPAAYLHALKAADAVVANSQWALRRAVALGVPQNTLHCINNGFGSHWNAGQHAALREHVREERGVDAQTLILIQVAAFRPQRGQRRLLEALAQWRKHQPERQWRLWLLGGGPTLDAVRARAHELGLADRVDFLGHQRHTYEYLCGADICVFASESESQPSALIEAQWAGLPVVSYAVGGAGECFLPEQSGFLIPQGQADAFAEALEALATDSDLRQKMGDIGTVYVHEHFNPVSQAQKYLQLFERL